MKCKPIDKRLYNMMSHFPKTLAKPQKNDIYFALFPYDKLGNMEKMRPVLIEEVKENSVIARMITTNSNPRYNKKLEINLKGNKKWKFLKEESYISNFKTEIPMYKLYGRIKSAQSIRTERNK